MDELVFPALDLLRTKTFFSSLACLMHTWRDVVKEVYAEFQKRRSPYVECAATVPPKPIAGRWGRFSAVVTYLLRLFNHSAGGAAELADVFKCVMNTKSYFKLAVAAEAAGSAEAAGELDGMRGRGRGRCRGRSGGRARGGRGRGRANDLGDTRLDDLQAHSEKMGNYGKAAVKSVQCPGFWIAVQVSKRITRALDMLYFSLMAKREPNTPNNLARLVFGRGAEIGNVIWAMHSPDSWVDVLTFASEHCSEAVVMKLECAIARTVARIYANYSRRILQRLRTCPVSLLLFAIREPTCPSHERATLANYLLSTDSANLQTTARKIKCLFGRSLRFCVDSGGLVTRALYNVFYIVACQWRADTQEVEGIHNLIKLAVA